MQQIGKQQQPVGMGQFAWLHLFVRVELEERIEGLQLDACALVQHIARNTGEDLLHHPVRTVVAILEGLAEQEAVSIYQAVIDPPGIDADAVERSGKLMCFTQSCQGIVPQTQNIPKAVPTELHRLVGKSISARLCAEDR